MKWFAINLIYQVISGEGKHSPQFNEQTRLIKAADSFNAIRKAQQNAGKFNLPIKNSAGDLVVWKFVAIGGILAVDEPADGVEVNSKIIEPESSKTYLAKLKHRNKSLTNLKRLDN
ncbi:DUF4288 domain-containing protein [Pedobacter chinensis]|uniref:DUF4288 domain-containing protein n=1 Tax=Pedobacter chinensis TaxID=2282421 RepID=A0A369PT38_9SPHI|nr:DUF4288 domain-containing protein [Pedobacter chinensis]RDC55684.1 DUF4288 domain-containing protein [Pedobacter chinensis]